MKEKPIHIITRAEKLRRLVRDLQRCLGEVETNAITAFTLAAQLREELEGEE